MDVNAIRAVANAVLYEGYMLYPYRPSALKNRSQGWTFGTLLPEEYAAAHAGEPFAFHAEVLVSGAEAQVSGEVRFLQLCGSDAVERTVAIPAIKVTELMRSPLDVPFALGGLTDNCRRVDGMVRVSAERAGEAAIKLALDVMNQSRPELAWDTRDQALQQALVSAHALLMVEKGEFISLLNPPAAFHDAVKSCTQSGVFPVLAGEEGQKSAMLISPIILYDYPQVAANSHGDFFDSSEIDEMLTLRVLTLTETEKEEMRANNDRARMLLERTEALSPEEILKLHGVVRGLSRNED